MQCWSQTPDSIKCNGKVGKTKRPVMIKGEIMKSEQVEALKHERGDVMIDNLAPNAFGSNKCFNKLTSAFLVIYFQQ